MNSKIIIWALFAILIVSALPAIAAEVEEGSNILVHITDPFEIDVKPPGVGKPPVEDPEDPPAQDPQVLPWGVDRIDAELASNTGSEIKVAVVDTGIDRDHPDLKDNIKGGVNFVPMPRKVDPTRWDDDNGHGTHVAGTIGALDNTFGVVGVAPNVHLYAVKVLDKRGSGSLSQVISGIEWAVTNDMDVITMSLSTDYFNQDLKDACDAAYAAGIVVVAASGNDGTTVDYPAAYDSVIAVGATDINDNIASFSNYGLELEMSAPGVSILSTWIDGYNTISGTSMATPHVTGTVALILRSTIGTYDLDGDGVWDPAEVRAKLTGTAEDLGASGYDTYFGFGLADAQYASA